MYQSIARQHAEKGRTWTHHGWWELHVHTRIAAALSGVWGGFSDPPCPLPLRTASSFPTVLYSGYTFMLRRQCGPGRGSGPWVLAPLMTALVAALAPLPSTTFLPSPGLASAFECGDTARGAQCLDACCSQYGYCGITAAYCAQGCQPDFGWVKLGGGWAHVCGGPDEPPWRPHRNPFPAIPLTERWCASGQFV